MKLTKGLKTGSRKKSATETISEKPKPIIAKASNGHSSTSKPITIEAKIDVGFGNTLYLRGEGTGLSWNHGVPLTCVDGSTWKWSGETGQATKFKLLLNDAVWSAGEDLWLLPARSWKSVPFFPRFSELPPTTTRRGQWDKSNAL
jgi:hypothetical protein